MYEKPLPVLDPLTRPFWEHARRGQLVVQACASCGHLHMPPTCVCPECLGKELVWKQVSGRGKLVSWVVFHRAYWPGFKSELPYNVCLVQLDEGPLFVSNLVNADAAAIEVGKPVTVTFDRVADEVTLPKFELA
jgi:uncharacterized OB-fold protein